MTVPFENETWLIEAGDDVIQKRARRGDSCLTPLEKLIYCVWVADYGIRNAGDLETASDLYPAFQTEACLIARTLSLQLTLDTFSLPRAQLSSIYLDRFDGVCDELRNA
jgi:hypothetical protein